MTTMVCFRSAGTAYCLPVTETRAVRPSAGMISLPGSRQSVHGVIPDDPPVTVIAPLGASGELVLVISAAGTTFGLLVEQVTGLSRGDESTIESQPGGRHHDLIRGTVRVDGQLTFVLDSAALAAQL